MQTQIIIVKVWDMKDYECLLYIFLLALFVNIRLQLLLKDSIQNLEALP